MHVLDLAAALWFGILTSLSPCPLATNIAAVSYISRQVDDARRAVLSGLFYTLGRTVAYTLLGAVLVKGAHAVPTVSMFLQARMNQLLGPLLILVGTVLLGVFRVWPTGVVLPERAQKRLAAAGLGGAFLLGVLFALAFCPVSAGLFFGSTFSLAVRHDSPVVMPALFGIGTAAPVIALAFLIAFGAHLVGATYNRLGVFEKYARVVSALAFVGVGLYLVASHNLRLL